MKALIAIALTLALAAPASAGVADVFGGYGWSYSKNATKDGKRVGEEKSTRSHDTVRGQKAKNGATGGISGRVGNNDYHGGSGSREQQAK